MAVLFNNNKILVDKLLILYYFLESTPNVTPLC